MLTRCLICLYTFSHNVNSIQGAAEFPERNKIWYSWFRPPSLLHSRHLFCPDVFTNCDLTEDVPSPAFSSATTTRGRTPSECAQKAGHTYINLLLFEFELIYSVLLHISHRRVPFWRFLITGADQNQELKMWCTVSWTCLQTIRLLLLLHHLKFKSMRKKTQPWQIRLLPSSSWFRNIWES